MHKSIVTAVTALGLAATGSALAQSDTHVPWRGDFWGGLGIAGGASKFHSACANTNVFKCDHRDSAYRVWADGQINRILGLEIGYTDFGRVSASGGETKAWAVPIELTLGAPIGDHLNIFAKGGGVFARTDVKVDLNDTFSNQGNRNGWGWTYGAGAAFGVTPNLWLRADLDRYRLDFVGGSRDVDLLTAGVQWRF